MAKSTKSGSKSNAKTAGAGVTNNTGSAKTHVAEEIAVAAIPVLQAASITVEFKNGLGKITASLFRNGTLVNMLGIDCSGVITFPEVQPADAISVNGICSGTASLTVDLPTVPPTPEHFKAQVIMTGYLVQ